MKSLADNLFDYIAAGYSGLWVESYEHDEACQEIFRLCGEHGWAYVQWDCAAGMARAVTDEHGTTRLLKAELTAAPADSTLSGVIKLQSGGAQPQLDFTKAVQAVSASNYDPQGAPLVDEEGEQIYGIVVVKNIHGFLNPLPVKQLILNTLRDARANRQVLIGLSHTLEIPQELAKVFQTLEHPLPDRGHLLGIAREIAVEEGELPEEGEPLEKLIDAAAGLTRIEAENAFSLSLVRHGVLQSKEVFELKAEALKQLGGALTLYRGEETFADVGGMSHLKQFFMDCLGRREPNPKFRARGVLLTGVTGSGKTYTAKALGKEVGRPVLVFDFGAILGRYVGQSEQNMRRVLRRAEVSAPCILVVDEVEKAMAGVSSSGSTDSGLKAGLFGSWLTWLNDCKADVYVVVTANDITKIINNNPEFGRQGRFDGMFFVDFPGREAKDAIWEIHLRGYGFLEPEQTLADLDQELPDDANMVGAEIEAICRLARLRRRSLLKTGETLPKIADQAYETIEATREWATGRCWSTEYEALYDKDEHQKRLSTVVAGNGKSRRKVARRRSAKP